MCPDSRCLFLGWFLFWFRVCELVIPLTNKGAPRSAFYIIHDCPELSTGRYSQIRIEGIMNSSSEKWNPRHYTSNMKPWSQLMETYHHVAAQVNPADFIIDLVSVHSDGGATWMLLICEQRRQGWGCPHKLQKTYTFMMHDAFNVLKCVWLCRTCFFPEDWWYSFVKAPYLLSLRSLFSHAILYRPIRSHQYEIWIRACLRPLVVILKSKRCQCFEKMRSSQFLPKPHGSPCMIMAWATDDKHHLTTIACPMLELDNLTTIASHYPCSMFWVQPFLHIQTLFHASKICRSGSGGRS